LSYNEVGWLPVRGLGAWPGACINSTSATSVRRSLRLSRSVSATPDPRFWPASALARSFFPRALHSLQARSGSSDAHTPALSSLHLPASTHQRSVPTRARSRIRRGYAEASSAIRYCRESAGTRFKEASPFRRGCRLSCDFLSSDGARGR